MKNLIHWINRRFAELCGYLLVLMMLLLIVDFISRGMYRPLQGIAELAVFVLVAVVYLGLPNCEQVEGHVNVTAFTKPLPEKIRQTLDVIVYLVSFIFLIFFVYSVGKNFIQSYGSNESIAGTVPFRVWPAKLTVLIGALFYSIQVFINWFNRVKKLFNIKVREEQIKTDEQIQI